MSTKPFRPSEDTERGKRVDPADAATPVPARDVISFLRVTCCMCLRVFQDRNRHQQQLIASIAYPGEPEIPARFGAQRSVAFPAQFERALCVKPELPLHKAKPEQRQVLVVVLGRSTEKAGLRLQVCTHARHLLIANLICTE